MSKRKQATKWHVRPVWSEVLLCAQWVGKDPSFLPADSEDSDLTGRMPRLIWVFAGRTCHFVGFVMRWLINLIRNMWAFEWQAKKASLLSLKLRTDRPAHPHFFCNYSVDLCTISRLTQCKQWWHLSDFADAKIALLIIYIYTKVFI